MVINPGVRIPLPPQIFAELEAKTVKLGPMSPGKKTIKGETATPLFVASCSYGGAKIENEAFVFALARLLVGLPKQRGWVNRCENF